MHEFTQLTLFGYLIALECGKWVQNLFISLWVISEFTHSSFLHLRAMRITHCFSPSFYPHMFKKARHLFTALPAQIISVEAAFVPIFPKASNNYYYLYKGEY
jgi:hypothetical protein